MKRLVLFVENDPIELEKITQVANSLNLKFSVARKIKNAKKFIDSYSDNLRSVIINPELADLDAGISLIQYSIKRSLPVVVCSDISESDQNFTYLNNAIDCIEQMRDSLNKKIPRVFNKDWEKAVLWLNCRN